MRAQAPFSLPVVLSACFLFCISPACGPAEGDGDGGDACTSDSECSGGKFCIMGYCKVPLCTSAADCPQGQVCLASGQCTTPTSGACSTDMDCAFSGKVCNKELHECWGVQCTKEGESRTCFVGCHEGVQQCVKGSWSQCNAPAYTPEETCGDQVDNNCDGQVDEGCGCQEGMTAPCTTPCGEGQKKCAGGTWGTCEGAEDCCVPGQSESLPCGNCGTKARACGEGGVWGEFSGCTGEGACPAGEVEEIECGTQCGKQIRICTDQCTWSEWGECSGSGQCAPGDTVQMDCGNCGVQEKLCGETCQWEPWGSCVEGAGCTSGDVDSKSCGKCGTAKRTCLLDCQWGDWGICEGEGECEPGEKTTDNCGSCGNKEKTCTPDCKWSSFGQCVGAGDCSPGDSESIECGPSSTSGICEKGTKQHTCNGSCQWNQWGDCLGAVWPQGETCGDGIDQDCDGKDKEAPDAYEPNDSCGACQWIDGDDPETTLYPTFDSPLGGADKDDYFCFNAVDNFNLPFTYEHIVVELKNQPLGVDGDLFLYKGSSACSADNHIASSVTIGGDPEKIDWTETSSADDGTYYVRVQNWSDKGSCYQSYTLTIKGLK